MKGFFCFFQSTSVIAVITVITFFLLNTILDPIVPQIEGMKIVKRNFETSDAQASKWIEHYGLDVVRSVYPGKTDAEIKQIVFTKYQAGNRYEPFVEFLQDPIFTDGMGVHEAGFRMGGQSQGPWPIDKTKLNVFVFGGSTAFGSGARDEETASAYLQDELTRRLGRPVFSYNFGVGAYYSSQELINFWRLARDGNFPGLVIFLDGLNDYFQKTEDTAHSGYYRDFEVSRVSLLKQLNAERGSSWLLQQAMLNSAFGRLAASLKTRNLKPASPGAEGAKSSHQTTTVRSFDEADIAHAKHVTSRLLTNFKLAAGMANNIGSESAFVIQPTPMYAYDLARHRFPVPDWHQYTRIGYPMLRERLDAGVKENIIWCADVQRTVPIDVDLYVDPVHYTSAMNKTIVKCIVEGLERSGTLRRLEKINIPPARIVP